MKFSKKSQEHLDACRFCWMCRHICPIGNATGQERNTSRARALGLSLVSRGAVDYSRDIVDNVYECALCGACVKECVTGWDPVMFTKEARLGAALDGKLPPYVLKMVQAALETGNIYGAKLDGKLAEKIRGLKKSGTLFFLGADARYKTQKNACEAIDLLQKLGADFTALENEPDSAYGLDFLVGATSETKAAAETCAKTLNGYGKVICYDPADAKTFKREYKEWGVEIKAEILTFTEYLDIIMKDRKVKESGLAFTPQDSPILARDLEETEPVRRILSKIGSVSEMLLNRRDTMLAGNLIMNEYMPLVMQRVAADRWVNAKNVGAKILVTESPAEYALLAQTKPADMTVVTIEEAINQCL